MIRHRRSILAVAASLALVFISGCEFPGSGVTVAFTSPTRDTRVTNVPHPYALTVTVTVTGGPPDTFELTNNGTPVGGVSVSGATYTASVPLADGDNTLVAKATAAGFSYTATRNVYYPFLALPNGRGASVVMGQMSFTTSAGSTTQYGLRIPGGPPALVGGNLYLPDTDNNRLVGYGTVPSSSPNPFSILIGQTLWTDKDPSSFITGNSVTGAEGVAGDGGNLVVADTGDNRVLLFNGAPTLRTAAATVEVGQPGMSSTSDTSCADDRLAGPRSAIVAGGKLIVADTDHNRVMIWNAVPTISGAAADLVLGRSDCTTGTTSATTLSAPSGVWSDGTRLLVADAGNNRVLLWNTFPTVTDRAADVVIGQSTMSGHGIQAPDASTLPYTGLSGPRGVDSNANQIFIADTGHNRVLVFDAIPSADGVRADRVLGQTGLTGASANAGGLDAGTLDHPQGVRAFDGFLIVADTMNSRELLYRPPSP